MTKPFTAALALDLLGLDEPTGVWPGDVRVRHLLSHTSGFDCENGDLARYGDGDDALTRAVADLGAVRRFAPAERVWAYSNAGFWLAGALAAARAGSTYEEAVATRVMRPAGLEATAFDEPDVEGSGPGVEPGPYPRGRRPSGGLVSTLDDLVRFGRYLLGSGLVARLGVVAGKPVAGVYGFGIFGQRVGGVDVWGHPGSYGGFRASFLVVPARGAVFVALTSSGNGEPALRLLEDAFFEEVLGTRRAPAPTVAATAAELDAFTGTYSTPAGPIAVARAGDGLAVHAPDGDVTARPLGGGVFELTGADAAGARFDFPLPGFLRFGSTLAERVG